MIDIDENIKSAKTLPASFYASKDIFDKSKILFENSIQPICSMKELGQLSAYPFEYFPEFLNESLVITKDKLEVRCLSNVCTHRAHLVALCSNNRNVLQCRYHGRTFELDGRLKHAPGFKNADNFPTKNDNLSDVSICSWNDLLFVSLSENDNVFRKLSQIDDILPNFPYLNLCKDPVRKEYTIDCHWALYCDNYLEGFHIPYVHKGLNSDMDWKSYKTEILDGIIMQKAISSDGKNSIDYDKLNSIYAYYFFIFPNVMINYYNWGVSINIVEPISKQKTRIKYIVYNLKGRNIPVNSSSSVDTVEKEDQEVVLSVQKGLKSRHYKFGRFSPDLEKGVYHFHKMIHSMLFKND